MEIIGWRSWQWVGGCSGAVNDTVCGFKLVRPMSAPSNHHINQQWGCGWDNAKYKANQYTHLPIRTPLMTSATSQLLICYAATPTLLPPRLLDPSPVTRYIVHLPLFPERLLRRFALVDCPPDGTDHPVRCAVRSSSGPVVAAIVDGHGSEMGIARVAKNEDVLPWPDRRWNARCAPSVRL